MGDPTGGGHGALLTAALKERVNQTAEHLHSMHPNLEEEGGAGMETEREGGGGGEREREGGREGEVEREREEHLHSEAAIQLFVSAYTPGCKAYPVTPHYAARRERARGRGKDPVCPTQPRTKRCSCTQGLQH